MACEIASKRVKVRPLSSTHPDFVFLLLPQMFSEQVQDVLGLCKLLRKKNGPKGPVLRVLQHHLFSIRQKRQVNIAYWQKKSQK